MEYLLIKPKFRKTPKELKLQKYERNKILKESGAGIGAMLGVGLTAKQLFKENKKGDLNKDGKMSGYEARRDKAIKNAMAKKKRDKLKIK